MRTAIAAILAVSSLALLPAPEARAAGESRSFKSHNFEWTLPDDSWEFREVGAQERNAGFVIKVASADGQVEAMLYAKGSDGLSLAERVDELAAQMKNYFDSGVDGVKIKDSTLSGLKGRVVVMQGRGQSGGSGHLRWYAIERKGYFYHLLVNCWNGSHRTETAGVNALRKGFRLIKGAEGEDADEAFDEFADAEGGEEEDATKSRGGASGPWPAKGPEREGDKLVFPDMNLEWTLPEGSIWSWDDPITDLANASRPGDRGGVIMSPVVWVQGQVKRDKKEFEQDTPDFNNCRGRLYLAKLPGQRDSATLFRQTPFQQNIAKQFGLVETNAARMQIKSDVGVGNFRGAYLLLDGEHRSGNPATILTFEVVLRGWMYQWQFLVWGHTDRMRDIAPRIGKLLDNVKFPESTDFVAGPLLGPDGIPMFSGSRGEDVDEEKEVRRAGYTFEKPEGVAMLRFSRAMNTAIQIAVEGRSEDGQAYVYLDVHAWSARDMRQMGGEEKLVEKRAGEWEASAGDEIDMGRAPYFRKGSLGRARGVKYEFTSEKDGIPYQELGWVVDHKQNVYWVRIQLAGEKAERKLKKQFKALKRALKWSR